MESTWRNCPISGEICSAAERLRAWAAGRSLSACHRSHGLLPASWQPHGILCLASVLIVWCTEPWEIWFAGQWSVLHGASRTLARGRAVTLRSEESMSFRDVGRVSRLNSPSPWQEAAGYNCVSAQWWKESNAVGRCNCNSQNEAFCPCCRHNQRSAF